MAATSLGLSGVLATKWVRRKAAVARVSAVIDSGGERLGHYLGHVPRQPVDIADALELRARLRLARGVELPPAIEAARHARRDLWIQRVERDDLVGEEGIAAAIGLVEARVVG